MRTSVVFPAPFGPRRPKTIPSGTSRSTPARAVVDPNRLTTPPTRTAGGRPRRDPLASGCDNEVALSGWPCTLHYLLAPTLAAPSRGWIGDTTDSVPGWSTPR